MDSERDDPRERRPEPSRERRPEPSRKRRAEPAHDILAAEAFAMGSGDPGLHREPPHDILAAEAFALPAPDRTRRATPRDEHSDDPAPHDVLSAEEYAMPAGQPHALPAEPASAAGRRDTGRRLALAVAGLILLRSLRRRRL